MGLGRKSGMNTPKADITEVFSSIQGEGIFLGARQVFVRFKDCNLACVFCDEPKDLPSKEYAPLGLLREVKRLERAKSWHHSVSLTGGEPLIYAEFLKKFLNLLKRNRLKSYLETNGTLPDALRKVIELVDIIAMDIKLPSSTGEKEYWREHREFLKIAAKKKAFVKVVITPDTLKGDIEKASLLVKKIDTRVPFILQPATPAKPGERTIDNKTLLRFLDIASKNNALVTTRIIPQVHKILNVK